VGKVEEKTEFKRLLDRAEHIKGQKQLAAEAIGIKPSRYSKLYGGNNYSLSVENCLRLATVIRESPGVVLRAAGKGEVAELIEKLYGTVADMGPTLPNVVREASEILMQMTEADQEWAIGILRRLQEGAPNVTPARGARPHGRSARRFR
jgi:hypothetical protein